MLPESRHGVCLLRRTGEVQSGCIIGTRVEGQSAREQDGWSSLEGRGSIPSKVDESAPDESSRHPPVAFVAWDGHNGVMVASNDSPTSGIVFMPPSKPFEALMDRLRAGDNEATTKVFNRFAGQVLALARRQLHSAMRS